MRLNTIGAVDNRLDLHQLIDDAFAAFKNLDLPESVVEQMRKNSSLEVEFDLISLSIDRLKGRYRAEFYSEYYCGSWVLWFEYDEVGDRFVLTNEKELI